MQILVDVFGFWDVNYIYFRVNYIYFIVFLFFS